MPALLPHAIASAPLAARCATRGHRPGFGHGPAAHAAGPRPAHGAGHLAAVIPTHFVVGIHGWTRVELARLRSLASAFIPTLQGRDSATHADLCPPSAGRAARVKIGGVLRGVLPRSSLRVGARAEMRYAARRREPNPASDPRSSRHFVVGTRLRAPFKSAENGEFPTALVRPRLPRPFFVQNRSLWGL